MNLRQHLKSVFVLALGGTLFAGYLSAIKIFTGTCAFNESCPYFLGYPSCWYGFALFLAMTSASAAALIGKLPPAKAARAVLWISVAGTLFAGYFVAQELARWAMVPAGMRYGLVLPTCVYGLVFYVIILVLSVRAARMKA